MAAEVFSRNTFDPRKHSAVAITVADKQPQYTGHSRGEEVPLKHYMVGPNVAPPGGLSLRRPFTAPTARRLPNGQNDPEPKVLNKNGKWVQSEVPLLIAESQAQPLSVTSTYTATLPGSGAQRAIRPVTAIYTYNDVSPVSMADMVRDTDLPVTVVKESTIMRPRSAVSNGTKASQALSSSLDVTTLRAAACHDKTTRVEEPDARKTSINAFWARQAGTAFSLGISDLERVEELGRNSPAGCSNTRLIGSRWKYIQRPVEGDVVYTDYYGICGADMKNYYGRAYHVRPAQFNTNRLVGDLDYLKLQASMPGIHTLRTRPGLVLENTIVNGPNDKLGAASATEVRKMRGVHKLHEFARMKPAGERQLRAAWNDRYND